MPKSKISADFPLLHENLPLIEVADKWLLDMLIADAVAGVFILTRLSDTVAVIAPDKFDALLARLRQLGHLPKVLGA
jgi:hypothetical protein